MWFIVQTKQFYKLLHAAHNGTAQSIHATDGKNNKEALAQKALISHEENNKVRKIKFCSSFRATHLRKA